MSQEDVIKNPNRNNDTAEYTPYTPQYQVLGLIPEEINLSKGEEVTLASKEEIIEVESRKNNLNFGENNFNKNFIDEEIENISIPNVGNNDEQLWLNTNKINDPNKKLNNKNEDTYVLIAKEQIAFIGSLLEVEDQVRKVFYEEHDLNKSGVTVNDLVVLKKIKIKIGVFVEE